MSIQKEDVYETENLPESDQHDFFRESAVDHEDIDLVHIDMDSAMQRFRGRIVNCDYVDFSDSIARKRRNGYGSGSYVLEVVGRDTDETETIEQKFQRLNCEMNELAEALQNEGDNDDKSNYSFDTNDVNALIETLKAMQHERNSPSQKDSHDYGASSTTVPVLKPLSTVDRRYCSFEARLRRIEEVFGGCEIFDDVTKSFKRAPLAEVIEDLRLRIQLLQPTHVDSLLERITQLMSKLPQIEEKRAERVNNALEQKIDVLYNMISKWDTICIGLPTAVQRIHDLQKLHEQAQQFSSKVSQLVGIYGHLMKKVEDEQTTLFEFRETTKNTLSKLASDVESLQERLKGLS